jgi:hypothetical protein
LTQVEDGFNKIIQSYQNTQQAAQQQQQTNIQDEIDEATAAHGDAIWKVQDDISFFHSKVNTETGKNFTVKEAYEKVLAMSGETPPSTPRPAPNRTGPGLRSVPSSSAPAGALDAQQVLDGLKGLGFE